MEAIHTTDLILEPLTVRHAEAMFPILSDPKLYRYLDYGPPTTIRHVRNVYEKLEQRSSRDGCETWLNWIVCLKGATPIGYVQATIVSPDLTWIAYFLGSKYWGHGYACSATKAMLTRLEERYGVKQLFATVEIDNGPSIVLLKRLFFEHASGQEAATHDLSNSELLYKRDAKLIDNLP